MIGFAIMMWFAAIILILTSVSLLKGHYSAMHGRTFERTSDKDGFAKALGGPILAAGIGIALSGAAAVALNDVVIPLVILVSVTAMAGIRFYLVVKRVSR